MSAWVLAVTLAAVVNPAGHWEGAVDTPQATIPFEIDFEQVNGALVGAITIPSQHLKGLPLKTVALNGRTITFGARSDQVMEATIADEGTSMAGTFTMATYSFPFSLTRHGEARIDPAPASARVASALEGEWKGTLSGGAEERRLVLTLHNDADGLARGDIVNLDEGGLRLPLAITQNASGVTLDTPVAPGSFVGALNGTGELVGTFRQGAVEVPLTFRRNE